MKMLHCEIGRESATVNGVEGYPLGERAEHVAAVVGIAMPTLVLAAIFAGGQGAAIMAAILVVSACAILTRMWRRGSYQSYQIALTHKAVLCVGPTRALEYEVNSEVPHFFLTTRLDTGSDCGDEVPTLALEFGRSPKFGLRVRDAGYFHLFAIPNFAENRAELDRMVLHLNAVATNYYRATPQDRTVTNSALPSPTATLIDQPSRQVPFGRRSKA